MSRPDPVAGGWTDEVSSGLALAGFLALVFVAFTVLVMGPLASFDAYFNLEPAPRRWLPLLYVLDRVGQRAVCLPILGVVAYHCARRRESWRPVVLAAGSVFLLNLVVLVLKVGLGRSNPHTADPSFFNGGMAYPSGHSANILLVYGLVAYLLGRYHGVARRGRTILWGSVAVLALTMVVTSLTLDWHWFGDLIAGLLVGGIVLQLTVAIDHAVPAAAGMGWVVQTARSAVLRRRGRSRGPSAPA